MIKAVFYTFIILLAAIGLGFLIHRDPGYAMISYNHWVIATSIWTALAFIFILFVVLYFFIRLFKNAAALPEIFSRASKIRNATRYQELMSLAMIAATSGDYAAAEKYFLKSVKRTNMPASNYLMAADMAQRQEKIKTRDKYLEKAQGCGANVGLVRFSELKK